jgi:hypothetical protein
MVSLRSLHDPAKGYNMPKILLMRIGKSQKASKNLTPEAIKNHLGKKKKSPSWNSISNLSPKKKASIQLGSNPIQPVASLGPQGLKQ